MPLISVIMPIYDTKESHLREAIDSVLSQTFEDFEFLILNDSPYNNKLKGIIANYSDERIKYCENSQNIGIPQSYNRLIELAQGKYIAIMNHDDIMLPTRLETQYKYLEKHQEIGILGSAYKKFGEINRFKTITPPNEDEKIKSYMLFKSSIHHPTIMFRKHIADTYKIRYNENFISLNDRLLCYEFSKYTKLSNLPQVLYKYRFHGDMTSKRKKLQIRQERAMFHKLWFAYNNINLTPEEIDVFDNYTTFGRQKFNSLSTLQIAIKTLEKLVQENEDKHFADITIFKKICGKYATKRCLNALINARVNIKSIIETTSLPIKKGLLKHINLILGWKK